MPAIGMDRETGRYRAGWEHVAQSLADILSTPRLSRVLRRWYGADTTKLIDAPMTQSTLTQVYVEIAEALDRHEPRFELRRVVFDRAGPDGVAQIRLAGVYFPNGHKGDRTPENGAERSVSLIAISESSWRAAA